MTQLSIIFLGTGGSWPTVKRNVSSIAVKRGREVLLFDCGEGTQRQIQKSNVSYMQISKIFITHFHGDHFLGLPGLIQTMQLNDRKKSLSIYGPLGINKLMKSLLNLGYFKPEFIINTYELKNLDYLEFDEYIIKTIKVDHGVDALGYCFEEKSRPGKFDKTKALKLGIPEGPLFSRIQKGKSIILKNGQKIKSDQILGPPRKGRKIVISGDTKPIKEMIEFSKHSDILIHDSTFDSKLEKLANDYGHSTTVQSAEIAKIAEVNKLFLTHISPRYLENKMLENEARIIFNNSFIAKDFQVVELKYKN
jgi:ribonuclease Z